MIEAAVLHAAGYRYAPFAMARYYFGEMDHYLTLFSLCRKAAQDTQPAANQPFVEFHPEGMRHTIDSLHARVSRLLSARLFEATLRRAYDEKPSTRGNTTSPLRCSMRAALCRSIKCAVRLGVWPVSQVERQDAEPRSGQAAGARALAPGRAEKTVARG